MQDKFKEFWLEKDKEEIIEAYVACIHNGEVLLARIDKAIEELELWKPKNKVIKTEIDYLLEILKGEK